MIAASEPLEFIPRGRQAVDEHPGPLQSKRRRDIPEDYLILHRLQNVNINDDDDGEDDDDDNCHEFWKIREIYEDINEQKIKINEQLKLQPNKTIPLLFFNEVFVNSEEELYVKGNTAVWSQGITDNYNNENESMPRICLTCESKIKHAFFCSKNFIKSENPDKRVPLKLIDDYDDDKNLNGICLVDSTSLRVYCNTGEDFITNLDFPISNIWPTRFGILLEKNPLSLPINDTQTISMPRLFSLSHPLEDIHPVLIKTFTGIVHFLNETDFKVIFANDVNDLVLLYDNKLGKHIISKLREATQDECNFSANETLAASASNLSSNLGYHNTSNNFFKNSGIGKTMPGSTNVSGAHNINLPKYHTVPSPNLLNSTPAPGPSVTTGTSSQNRSQMHTPLEFLQSSLGSHQTFSVHNLRKIGQAQPSKPIVPKFTLDHIWTENQASSLDYNEIASNGFFHYDLIGQTFLCYLLPRNAQLNLIRVDKLYNSDKHSFFYAATIPAKNAVCLNRLNMFAILDLYGTIILYTGSVKIGKLHVSGILSCISATSNLRLSFDPLPRRSSLLPTIKATIDPRFGDEIHTISPVHPLQPQFGVRPNGYCTGIRDPAGNRITLTYLDGKMYRVTIPLLCECPFVTKCIIVLRQILNKDRALSLLSKWYVVRNAPGSQDFSPQREWSTFKNILLDLLGRPVITSEDTSGQLNITNEEPKKRRKNMTAEGSLTDWNYLKKILNKNKLQPSVSPTVEQSVSHRNDTNAILFPYTPIIFFTLHLFYENMKLDLMMNTYLETMAELLYQLAMDLQLENYCLHYFLDYPQLIYIHSNSYYTESEMKKFESSNNYLLQQQNVPNIFKYIYDIVKERIEFPYPTIENVNNLSKDIIKIISLISTGNDENFDKFIKMITPIDTNQYNYLEDDSVNFQSQYEKNKKNCSINLKVVYMLIDLNITRQNLENLPTAIHYLIAEAIEHSRLTPPVECGSKAYELLLRPELLKHISSVTGGSKNQNEKSMYVEDSLSPRIQIQPSANVEIKNIDFMMCNNSTVSNNAININNTNSSNSNNNNNNINNNNNSNINNGNANEDGMEHIDTKLFHLRFPKDLRINEVRRILSSSNPITIDVVQLPGVNDHDFMEEQEKTLYNMCTRTMALPLGRGMFTLRTILPISTESLKIPKLCLTGKETLKGATIELQQVEIPTNMSLWPLFHNGVAAGLQISQDAKDIDTAWIVYNKPKGLSETTTEHAGFLMALGLNDHLKSLSFMSIYEYLVKCDEMTSVGLILGISVAHRSTMSTTITKLLSVHIEALLPATALELDIPQNVQVAAIMGIGLIYQGTAKRHIAEVLLQEIGRPPGPEMDNCVERESYALTAGLALGLVTLGQGESPVGLKDLQIPDVLHYYMVGGSKRPLSGAQKEKYKLPSFQVREGDVVNIDVTAPGATIALGLMFFNTGNTAVANWMKPPDTHYLLDLVRPDMLLLRTISRNLILWNDIQPTSEWLKNQYPASLAFNLKRGPVPQDTCLEVDNEALSQAYCNIITGAAFSMGLRYAGTENEDAFNCLNETFTTFISLANTYTGEHAGKSVIDIAVTMIVISVSMIFAGTGNLSILRMCRMLRERLGAPNIHVTYGSHMGVHMALGFLFLGSGRFTLSRSPQAIAALICALFPKFPTHSNDNRYHLQAFRHLYVLAIEARLFLPRDIDSGKLCLANIKYIHMDSTEITKLAPCIIPELDSIKSVIITDTNYWPVCFEKGRNWDQLINVLSKSQCIDIKQKAGCLSQLEDPDRLKSLLAQTITSEQYACWKIDLATLLSFSNDPKVQNFISKFLTNKPLTECGDISTDEIQLKQILTIQFYNCLTKDKIHALPIYMNLIMALQNMKQSLLIGTYDVWQFKILSAILDKHQNNILLSTENLKSLIQYFINKIELIFNDNNNKKLLKQYLFSSNIFHLNDIDKLELLQNIVALITFYDIPINIMNVIDLGIGNDQLNYLRMLMTFKKFNLETHTIHCISNILKFNN